MTDDTRPVNPARKSISRRLRFEVMKRDGHTCRYCGASAPEARLTVDHVIPVALGGGDEPSNLVTACDLCNGGKSSSSPDAALVDEVNATAMLFARAMASAAQLQRNHDAHIEDLILQFWCEVWPVHGFTALPEDSDASLKQWIDAGLSLDDLRSMSTQTWSGYRSDPWRYFAGCCWHRLRARADMALRLIEEGHV